MLATVPRSLGLTSVQACFEALVTFTILEFMTQQAMPFFKTFAVHKIMNLLLTGI